MLINEPDGRSLPKTDYTKARFEEWSKTYLRKEFTDKGFPVLMDLYELQFQNDYCYLPDIQFAAK